MFKRPTTHEQRDLFAQVASGVNAPVKQPLPKKKKEKKKKKSKTTMLDNFEVGGENEKFFAEFSPYRGTSAYVTRDHSNMIT